MMFHMVCREWGDVPRPRCLACNRRHHHPLLMMLMLRAIRVTAEEQAGSSFILIMFAFKKPY